MTTKHMIRQGIRQRIKGLKTKREIVRVLTEYVDLLVNPSDTKRLQAIKDFAKEAETWTKKESLNFWVKTGIYTPTGRLTKHFR